MESSPFPAAGSAVREPHDLQFASRWLWRATWAAFGVVLAVGVAGYAMVFLSSVVPLWLLLAVGNGLTLSAAMFAVNVDVVDARRKRGKSFIDLIARVAALLLVGWWLAALWTVLADGCFTQECDPIPIWRILFVLIPVVPLAGLTLGGFLVRRDVRRHA